MPEWWTAVWKWIEGLQGGAPQFLGSLTGALLGLLGLLLGALYNARLNRKRDDRLRNEERRALASALRAELAALRDGLLLNAEKLERDDPADVLIPDIAHSVRLLPELIGKIGLLDQETIAATMKALLLAEEYASRLVLMQGRIMERLPSGRVMIGISKDRTKTVARLNRVTAREIDSAVRRLDSVLGQKAASQAAPAS